MSENSYSVLYLPEIALDKIFSFLTFDDIAKNRVVCKKFNEVCSKLLSRGFIQLEKRHNSIYKKVRSLLPRRESERRAHPLARHCDILQAVETRISMLNMTYMKYIESSLLCFIPGKVLDEMHTVLALVESDKTPPRTHHLLQELRDLSSMAMEHFDEHILPRVKEDWNRRSVSSYGTEPLVVKPPKILLAQNALTFELLKVKKQSKSHKNDISSLTQSTQRLVEKLRKQNMRLRAQSFKIKEQEQKIHEQTTKIQEQEATLTDIKKHIDEWDQKYKDLTTELVKARDDILSGAIPKIPPSGIAPIGSPKCYKSNIKPRVTHILPKSYRAVHFDLERKRKSSLLPEICLKRNKSATSDNSSEDLTLQISNSPSFIESKAASEDALTKSVDTKLSRTDIGSMIASSLETFLKHPIMGIKSRKRKMTQELDLK